MADFLAVAQSYLKTSVDSPILTSLCPSTSDPLPVSISGVITAFQKSNQYYGNLLHSHLQQMHDLNREIDDHGFQLVSPGGPSVISTQTINGEFHHQSLSTKPGEREDDGEGENQIDEELVRTLDRDLDQYLLLLSEDEEVYLASDEEDEFPNYHSLSHSMATLDVDAVSGSGLQCAPSLGERNKMSETPTSCGGGAHDEFLHSAGWWISEDYYNLDDPNATFIGREPEFAFRFNEEELSSGPDVDDEDDEEHFVMMTDDEGFFSSDYFD